MRGSSYCLPSMSIERERRACNSRSKGYHESFATGGMGFQPGRNRLWHKRKTAVNRSALVRVLTFPRDRAQTVRLFSCQDDLATDDEGRRICSAPIRSASGSSDQRVNSGTPSEDWPRARQAFNSIFWCCAFHLSGAAETLAPDKAGSVDRAVYVSRCRRWDGSRCAPGVGIFVQAGRRYRIESTSGKG